MTRSALVDSDIATIASAYFIASFMPSRQCLMFAFLWHSGWVRTVRS